MRSGPGTYLLALGMVVLVVAATAPWLPMWGLASSALLFLLPVLFASARDGLGPGLLAAGAGALAYNFFLLPPRFTLRVHGLDNVVSVIVLVAVAVVTSRLATALKAREAEARARASGSEEAAAFSALLGKGEAATAVEAALNWLRARNGQARILRFGALPDEDAALSTLDLSAAAWAMHNGDMTGHGSAVMPAADWTFLPLSPRRQEGSDLLAVARPVDGTTRGEGGLAQLQTLARFSGRRATGSRWRKNGARASGWKIATSCVARCFPASPMTFALHSQSSRVNWSGSRRAMTARRPRWPKRAG